MNKYVVAWCNLHTGELKQEIVEAKSALEAGKSYLNWDSLSHINTLEMLYEAVFDSDGFLNVLEITGVNKLSKNFSSNPVRAGIQ